MSGINRKKFWQGSDSNPEPSAWEPCWPKPTAVIYFWIKRVANFGQTKKSKTTLLNEKIFLFITYTAKNKKEKIQQGFLWALGREAKHLETRSEYRTEPDNIKNEKLIKLYNRYYLPKRNKYNSRDFFGQNKHTETPEDHWGNFLN